MYTDPSGEFVFTTAMVITIAVSAALGTAAGLYTGYKAGATGWNLVAYGGVGLVAGVAGGFASVGVAAGLAGTAVAGTFIGGMAVGAAGGAAGGLINGIGTSLLGGGSWGTAIK